MPVRMPNRERRQASRGRSACGRRSDSMEHRRSSGGLETAADRDAAWTAWAERRRSSRAASRESRRSSSVCSASSELSSAPEHSRRLPQTATTSRDQQAAPTSSRQARRPQHLHSEGKAYARTFAKQACVGAAADLQKDESKIRDKGAYIPSGVVRKVKREVKDVVRRSTVAAQGEDSRRTSGYGSRKIDTEAHGPAAAFFAGVLGGGVGLPFGL